LGDILRVPEVTGAVLDWLKAHEVEAGFLTLFSRHNLARHTIGRSPRI
jgi:thiamine phosphate synthase YjbQ (UPF0047 family)